MSVPHDPKSLGYTFTLLAVAIFAAQDGISKYLGSHYSPIFITMVRYWAFAVFVILLAMRAGELHALLRLSVHFADLPRRLAGNGNRYLRIRP